MPPKRQYPPFYEKAVPVILGAIAIAVILLILFIIAVLSGWSPA